MALRSFLDSLSNQLTRQCPWVKSLVTQGYFIEKTKLIVLNHAHAVQIDLRRQGGVGAVRQYTWEDPHLGLTSVVAAMPIIAVARPAAASSPVQHLPRLRQQARSRRLRLRSRSRSRRRCPRPRLQRRFPTSPRHSLKGCHQTSATSTRSARRCSGRPTASSAT